MTNQAQQVNKADLTETQVSIINQLYSLLNDCCIKCHGDDVFPQEILEMVVNSHGWEWDEFYDEFIA